MGLKGSKTQANLQIAFAGESMARNRYTYYSSQAKKDGYGQIADLFLETAENEKEHAKMWFKLLSEDGIGIDTTAHNLISAADDENYEWKVVYPEFARIAREEGFFEIAKKFELVGEVEKNHERRFLRLLHNVRGECTFTKNKDVIWQCSNCGHICFGRKAPMVCPVCEHPMTYFQRKAENY